MVFSTGFTVTLTSCAVSRVNCRAGMHLKLMRVAKKKLKVGVVLIGYPGKVARIAQDSLSHWQFS